MLCEGDKTYPLPGDCPVCGMHLKLLEVASKGSSKLGVIYTCPMHPEIRSEKPGSCPKCGMTLVPENEAEPGEEESAFKKMVLKFRIALTLSIPVFIIAMSDVLPFLHLENIASKNVWNWIEYTSRFLFRMDFLQTWLEFNKKKISKYVDINFNRCWCSISVQHIRSFGSRDISNAI
jgi:hypothetical protein